MRKVIFEDAPPGRKKQVEALKKKFGTKRAFQIAWSQHNKHGKPKKDEGFERKLDKALGLNEDIVHTFHDFVINGVPHEITVDAHDYSIQPPENAEWDYYGGYPGTVGGVEDFQWDIVDAYKLPKGYSDPIELTQQEKDSLKRFLDDANNELAIKFAEELSEVIWNEIGDSDYDDYDYDDY